MTIHLKGPSIPSASLKPRRDPAESSWALGSAESAPVAAESAALASSEVLPLVASGAVVFEGVGTGAGAGVVVGAGAVASEVVTLG